MVKKINVFEGLLCLLEQERDCALGIEPKFRKDVFNDAIKNITIDTAKAFDTKMWETGIKRDSVERKWVIVKQYKNRAEAKRGHKKWVELMKKTPRMELKDINVWDL